MSRVALIVGASKDLGEAIARELASRGFIVYIADPDVEKARRVAEEINREGGKAEYTYIDVTSWEEVERAVNEIIERYGRIDVLVNSFSTAQPRSFLEMTLEDWDRAVNVNLRGVFIVTRLVVPHMAKQKYGRIINISSPISQLGVPQLTHYCASMGGVDVFTRALAMELASYGITVNAIYPGRAVKMPGTEGPASVARSLRLEKPATGMPRERLEEVAKLVAFLVSEEASHITGRIL